MEFDVHTLEGLEKLVDHIILSNELYFRTHQDATVEQKTENMQNRITKALECIDIQKGKLNEPIDQNMLMYLRARLLNLSSDYNAEAENIMTRFVKFNPRNDVAWNLLGEIFWKKKDYENARNCFEGSQTHVKNKDGMINLSLLLRCLPYKTDEEFVKNVKLSVEKAHEAVKMDISYGKSWYALGNAYLNLFFVSNQDSEMLKHALKAYQHAAKDVLCCYIPEFNFNRGMALRCNQDFGDALECFEMACRVHPTWKKASDQYNGLLTFLQNIKTGFENKGRLSARKYRLFMSSLEPKLLGPYENENGSGNTALTYVKFSDLTCGKNDGKVVLGKVVCHVFDPEPLSFTFCMIDGDGTCFVVTVYNIAQEKGVIIGDSVAIPDPVVENLNFEHKEKKYEVEWIKVDDPLHLAVNGKLLNRSCKASWQAVSLFKP